MAEDDGWLMFLAGTTIAKKSTREAACRQSPRSGARKFFLARRGSIQPQTNSAATGYSCRKNAVVPQFVCPTISNACEVGICFAQPPTAFPQFHRSRQPREPLRPGATIRRAGLQD